MEVWGCGPGLKAGAGVEHNRPGITPFFFGPRRKIRAGRKKPPKIQRGARFTNNAMLKVDKVCGRAVLVCVQNALCALVCSRAVVGP